VAEFTRVLVTGGAGFIGSNYVRYALREKPARKLVVLDKLAYAGSLDNLRDVMERIEFVRGDITEPADVRRALQGCDAVVNFAAESHVDRSLLDSAPFVRTNVAGASMLLEAARELGVKRFCQVSTDEVYGDLAGTARHSVETDALHPRSPYAATKAAAEHLAMSCHLSFGLDVVVTRGSNTYGPWQYPEKIIPLFITNALDNRHLPVYGDGSAVRDYMHVEDHCAGIETVLCAGAAGQAYNLGARLEVPGREVAERIVELTGRPAALIRNVPDRPGHDYRYSVDPAKAEALGWRRRWTWPDGLAQAVRWYRDHEDWWRAVKEKLEFRKHDRAWYADR